MSLQLSNTTKNKSLNALFRLGRLYVMIPTVDGAGPNAYLPSAEIVFSEATNGQIRLAAQVNLAVEAGTTINAVYFGEGLTNATVGDAIMRIDLTGDDVETYENNGVYIINTINVAINT